MSNNRPFRIKDRIRSFKFAIEGIAVFFRTEHNARIHLFAAVGVLVFAYLFKVTRMEFCWLIAAIAVVFVTEMINTSIELLCNELTKEINPQIKKIKDISAGAVLVAVLGSVAIGLLIFIPKLL